jgi:4-azaleucine resistance transporter AzlC
LLNLDPKRSAEFRFWTGSVGCRIHEGAVVAEPTDTRRIGFTDGLRAMAPLLLAVFPFGLVLGVTAAGSAIGGGLGIATSPIIFAGAAQLVTIQLFDTGTSAVVVIATALVVNIRHLMYSAALAPHFSEWPRRSRLLLPYLLTDQAFALSSLRFETTGDPVYKRWFYLGTGLALWLPWQLATIIGVALGAQIPESLGLGFAIPLVFLVLLIPSVQSRPGLLAAIVGGVVAVAASGAPYGLGLVIGAMVGVATAVAVERVGEQ